MSAADAPGWRAANQRYLTEQLAWLRGALLDAAGEAGSAWAGAPVLARPPVMAHPQPAALDALCEALGLSPFARAVLLLCAGYELEADFAALCAAVHGDPRFDYPTFGLALAALPDPDWDALAPDAPLRRWQLVTLDPGRAMTRSPLRLDERVLHFLLGREMLDARLEGVLRRLPPLQRLAPSQQAQAEALAAAWARAAHAGGWPAAQVYGAAPGDRQAVAAAACALLGKELLLLPAALLPAAPDEQARLLALWEREAALGPRALLVDCETLEPTDTARAQALVAVVERLRGPRLIASRERAGPWERPLLAVELTRPDLAERRQLWRAALGPSAALLAGPIEQLAAQFDLDAPALDAAVSLIAPDGADTPAQPGEMADTLWEICRAQARPHLDDLAQRIPAVAGWNDLVLPDSQREILREIVVHVRQRGQVYDAWGFAEKSQRGLGISALFAGPSGTGKTMAAEVLANTLRLDLYRIDLSQVVSKYIGETEKNLRRVFAAAERGGAILLFDEADALFGKRSEVKDSHDRYANLEVSYLLQLMEAYSGLAILTTNLKSALDSAFLRRIRFVVQFPFPDAPQRAEIWRRVFPPGVPLGALIPERLGQLNVAGGNIKNIALHAAFLAAEERTSVGMPHLLRAARRECAKLERALPAAEIAGWLDPPEVRPASDERVPAAEPPAPKDDQPPPSKEEAPRRPEPPRRRNLFRD